MDMTECQCFRIFKEPKRERKKEMQNQIFRKKSLDRVASPDQLDDYIHVTRPSVWVVFAAIALLLIGVCVWSAFGYLDTTASMAAYADDQGEKLILYVNESSAEYVKPGTVFRINGMEYTVSSIENDPVRMETANGLNGDMLAYALHVGDLIAGEWVRFAYAEQGAYPLQPGIYEAAVVLERVHPMTFILN